MMCGVWLGDQWKLIKPKMVLTCSTDVELRLIHAKRLFSVVQNLNIICRIFKGRVLPMHRTFMGTILCRDMQRFLLPKILNRTKWIYLQNKLNSRKKNCVIHHQKRKYPHSIAQKTLQMAGRQMWPSQHPLDVRLCQMSWKYCDVCNKTNAFFEINLIRMRIGIRCLASISGHCYTTTFVFVSNITYFAKMAGLHWFTVIFIRSEEKHVNTSQRNVANCAWYTKKRQKTPRHETCEMQL